MMRSIVAVVGFLCGTPLAYAAVFAWVRLSQWLLPLAPISVDRYRRFYRLDIDDNAIRRIHSKAMTHKLFYYLDLFSYAALPARKLVRRITLIGEEHFEQIKDSGRPILFLQMHSGAFYSLLVWLAHDWRSINAVFVNQSPLRQAVHDAALMGYVRERLTTYRDVVAALRRGESCLIMFDGGKFNPKHAAKIVINGCDIYFPTSSLAMARETGCHILPVFSARRNWRETVFHFGQPVQPDEDCTMQRIFDWYQPLLQSDPTQWFAMLENLQAGERISAGLARDGSPAA